MNTKLLYLTINIFCIAIPLAFSFHPKMNFSKKWKYVLPGIAITAVVFVLWDIIFTKLGVWGFNTRYISGIWVGNLPVEEVLFFICIPYACIFTYFALTNLIEKDYLFPHHELISSAIIIGCLVMGLYFLDRAYTSVTFLLTGLFLTLSMLKIRPRYMGRFYMAFLVLMIPFFLINGILTGSFIDQPIVWYDNAENLGLRIGTVPIEDVFYGMLMILGSISIAEALEDRDYYRKKKPAGI